MHSSPFATYITYILNYGLGYQSDKYELYMCLFVYKL